ncbi:MAG: recombination protein F [Candidatus Bathyarchaeota archaeon BA2]|nr:MAG: recombination protein F [Candidatus Bathyarchaeota archaeon BA2]
MPTNIKSINIHAFRGIPDLDLPLDGSSLLIKGENGTGKSSIVEAFEFFFTGKLSIFEGEGTQSLSLQKHAPHNDFSRDDVSIKITFDPGKVTLERTFADQPELPSQLKDYFNAASKGTFILRRSQILKFIASVPSDRFRAIASILGVEQLDNVELAMKRAYEEVDEGVNSKRERIQSTLVQISGLLGESVAETNQVLPSINRRLAEAGLITITSFDEVDNIVQEMLKTTDLNVTRLSEISEKLKTLRIDEQLIKSLGDLNRRLTPFLEAKTKRELSINEFLVKSRQAVEEDERNICPLCGQVVDREELLKQINERLQTLSQLSEEASEIRRTSLNIEEKLSLLAIEVEKMCSELEPYKQLNSARLKLLKMGNFFRKFTDKVKTAKEFNETIPVDAFEAKHTNLKTLVESLSAKCQTMLEKIGVPEDWKNKIRAITIVSQVKGLVSETTKIESDLRIEEQQLEHIKMIYNTFSETKKSKKNEIYEAIVGNVNAFYSMLHPNDPHRNIELKIAAGRRASAELRIESFDRSKEDPRAFTSEAHQDSLGLCIFLAFVKKFNAGCNFIVLDDVVTTIDAQHRQLICKLLLEQFKDYQLFITTHDGIWYEQLRSHQRAFKVNGNWKNLEIIRWTLQTGPLIEPFKPRWEKIKDKLDSCDKQGAAIEGRNYLEWLLKEICRVTMARPIFKTDRYTVADLLVPAKERLNELAKEPLFQERTSKGFQELEATVIMGNLLAHDNPEAENVSIEEVKRFCEAVHALHNIFLCPECGSFLRYYQDMKKLRCPDPHCQKPTEIACR